MAETDAPTTTQRRKLKRLEEQERKLVFTDFSHADAWQLGTILVGVAAERNLAIAIRITIGEQTAFQVGMPGSSSDNDDWLVRKARAVQRFGASTFLLKIRGEVTGRSYAELDTTRFAIAGGCVPIKTESGALLGTVGVSGLAQADDHALVVDAVLQFLSGENAQ